MCGTSLFSTTKHNVTMALHEHCFPQTKQFGGDKMKSEITIKMARCKGCGICVAFCPKQVLALDELGKVHVRNGEACIACGQCELRCPDYAIFVDKKVGA